MKYGKQIAEFVFDNLVIVIKGYLMLIKPIVIPCLEKILEYLQTL